MSDSGIILTASVRLILLDKYAHTSSPVNHCLQKRANSNHWFLENVTESLMWGWTNTLSTDAQNALTLKKGELHRLKFITVKQSWCFFWALNPKAHLIQSTSALWVSMKLHRTNKWMCCTGLLFGWFSEEFPYCIFTLWNTSTEIQNLS